MSDPLVLVTLDSRDEVVAPADGDYLGLQVAGVWKKVALSVLAQYVGDEVESDYANTASVETITGIWSYNVAPEFNAGVRMEQESSPPSGVAGYSTLYVNAAGALISIDEAGSSETVSFLERAQSFTATQTFSGVDINGGNIDGTIIGAATAAAGSFTTLGTSGLASLNSLSLTTVLSATYGGTGLTSISTLLNSNVTPTTLGLVIGTSVQAYHATLAAVSAGTYTGSTSIVTLGTIATGAIPASLVTAGTFGAGAYVFPSTLASGTHTISSDLILATGSITSASGAISFGNENLTTTGVVTIGADSTSVKLNIIGNRSDVAGEGFVTLTDVYKSAFRLDTSNRFNLDMYNGSTWYNAFSVSTIGAVTFAGALSGITTLGTSGLATLASLTVTGAVILKGATMSTFIATLIDDATQGDAQTTLGVDPSGTDNSTDVTLGGSLDYITLSGQVLTRNAIVLTTDVSGVLPVANGGTALTSISTLLNSNVTPTTLSLVIGEDTQAYSSVLDGVSAGTYTIPAERVDPGTFPSGAYVFQGALSGITDLTMSGALALGSGTITTTGAVGTGVATHGTGAVVQVYSGVTSSTFLPQLMVFDGAFSGGILVKTDSTTAARGGQVTLARSNGSTNGLVNNGDVLGAINFAGADGADYRSVGASIVGVVSGTAGVNDMPASLKFYTTQSGNQNPTLALTIDATQVSTFASTVITTASGGFKSATTTANDRTPIWRVGDADAYGFSYFRGTASLGTDGIGFHLGTATAAASILNIIPAGIVVTGTGSFTGNVLIGTTTDTYGTLQVSGEMMAGDSLSNALYTSSGSLNGAYGTDTDSGALIFNNVGYQNGTSRFRDSIFKDGKNTTVMSIDGSAKALTMVDGANFVLGGSTLAASATNTIHVYDGTAPTGAITNGALLWSEGGEMKVMDSGANTTTLSPHNSSLLPAGHFSELMGWGYYSTNSILGYAVNADISKALRYLEQLLGEDIVHLGKWNGSGYDMVKGRSPEKGRVQVLEEDNEKLQKALSEIELEFSTFKKSIEDRLMAIGA